MSGGASQMGALAPGSAGLPAGDFDGTSGTAGMLSGADMSASTTALNNATDAALNHPNGAGSTAKQMPQWQKGLMGIVTGSSQYGQNAPVMHAMLTQGLGMATQGSRSPQGGGMQMPPTQMGSMPMNAPAPGIASRPMTPQPMGGGAPMQQGAPQGMPQGQGMSQGAPNPLQGVSPQMLAQLRQQYPQLFQGAMGQ